MYLHHSTWAEITESSKDIFFSSDNQKDQKSSINLINEKEIKNVSKQEFDFAQFQPSSLKEKTFLHADWICFLCCWAI
jgi:hypothetical protein